MRALSGSHMLNDEAINGCSAILAFWLKSQPHSFAYFSSYEFARWQQNGRSRTWNFTRHLQYWNRNVWIIPVHDSVHLHWTVATVYPALRRIDYFDSLSDEAEYVSTTQVRGRQMP
jgi:Ulp1 family protease